MSLLVFATLSEARIALGAFAVIRYRKSGLADLVRAALVESPAWIGLTAGGLEEARAGVMRPLDLTWEMLVERRRAGMDTKIIGVGTQTEVSVLRYPWDAILMRDGIAAAVAAHGARWKR